MTIGRMTLCEWRGARVEKVVVVRPTLDQVMDAVKRLDNGVFNDVYFEPDSAVSDVWLCVGGGAGRYLLSGAVSNERFPTLVDLSRQGKPHEALVVGGQEGSYPGNQVHDLQTALDAVREFWSTGSFDGVRHTWLER